MRTNEREKGQPLYLIISNTDQRHFIYRVISTKISVLEIQSDHLPLLQLLGESLPKFLFYKLCHSIYWATSAKISVLKTNLIFSKMSSNTNIIFKKYQYTQKNDRKKAVTYDCSFHHATKCDAKIKILKCPGAKPILIGSHNEVCISRNAITNPIPSEKTPTHALILPSK